MNKENLKSNIWAGIGIAFIIGMFAWAIWYGTSAECWYAGMHDSQCEKLHGENTCECYERLVAADKEEQNKQNNK